MKIKRKPVVFHNLLSMKRVCGKDELLDIAMALKELILTKGLYINAPVFYTSQSIDKDKYEYTVYVPINAEVEVSDEIPVTFIKEFEILDALVFRLADPNPLMEAEAYMLLDAAAESQKMELVRPFYHIMLNVFDDTMIDIVAPIKNT
jgi:hypothetical protein